MYKCDICGTPYDEPHKITEKTCFDTDSPAKSFYACVNYYCPICGHIADLRNDRADQCQCGNYKNVRDALCYDCHAKLLKRFREFADGLTEPEENDLDAMLDGNSITDRNKWR